MTALPTNQKELDKMVEQFCEVGIRNFDFCVKDKVKAISDYLTEYKINNVVVGVSGGIDSAVVVALLSKVQEINPSLVVRAYTIHFSVYDKIFEPKYVDLLKERFGSPNILFKNVDGTNTLNTLMRDLNLKIEPKHYDNMLRAQSSYALRYQMFFTYAQAYGAVTIGTTNKDEFDYAGWFGKNSDMVVDLQVITDWHKFQVIEAAKILGVPMEVIERKPVGDLLDKSTDEENFGCTYNELAYFQEEIHPYHMDDNPFLIEKFAKLRELHKKNAHKYMGQTFNPVFIL